MADSPKWGGRVWIADRGGLDMDGRRRAVERLASGGDEDAIVLLDRMDVRLGHREPLIDRALLWTIDLGWWREDYQGPARRCLSYLVETIQEHFGCPRPGRWGDAEGAIVIDGLTFVVMPPKHNGKGRHDWGHRLKIKCPECGNLYGPAKWRQHYDYKHSQLIKIARADMESNKKD